MNRNAGKGMYPTQSLETLPRHGKLKGPTKFDMQWGPDREEEKAARTLESQEVPLGAQPKFSGASVRRVERDLEARSPRSPQSP